MSNARNLANLLGTGTQIKTDKVADEVFQANDSLIINGDMAVAQRQTSKQIVGSASDLVCDRFEVSISSDATVTVSQDATVPSGQGFTKSTKLVVDTADTSLSSAQHNLFQQKIEGFVGKHLMWGTSDAKTVTVSFWIRSSLTGSFTYYFLDGNANSQSYVAPFTINTVDTWEYKTIKIAAPTTGGSTDFPQDNSRMMYTGFNLGAGSGHQTSTVNSWHDPSGTFATARSSDVSFVGTTSATMYVTGWKLEVGDTATPFQHESYADNLQKCLRYYYKTPDESLDYPAFHYGTLAITGVPLRVIMRANPTVTDTTTSAYYEQGTSYTYTPGTPTGRTHLVALRGTVSGGTTGYAGTFYQKFTADAELQL